MVASDTGSASKTPRPNASRWVAEHGDVLYRFALMRIGDPAAAEDLVQETFLAALKGLSGFQGESSERTWLTGILKHKIVDHLRHAARERPSEDIDIEVDAYFNERGDWAVPPSVGENPLKNTEQQEMRKHLAGCLETLPPRLSQAFVLTQVDGLVAEEACKLLGVTTTNLWVMLHRSRLRLRQCLQKRGFGRESPD